MSAEAQEQAETENFKRFLDFLGHSVNRKAAAWLIKMESFTKRWIHYFCWFKPLENGWMIANIAPPSSSAWSKCATNHDNPIILDAFAPFTVLQGYIRAGRYRIFERVPYLTQTKENLSKGCIGCKYHDTQTGQCAQWRNQSTRENGVFNPLYDKPACQHRVPEGEVYEDYVEVTFGNMTDPSGFPEWKLFSERTEDYENARRNWTDLKQ